MTGIREVLLKARQEGLSTLVAVLFFLDTINNANTTTVVVAHDDKTTKKLFEMVALFYKRLPTSKQPPLDRLTLDNIKFAHNQSTYFVGTAGSAEIGRSQTINNLHGSEVAFWPNSENLALGLLQTVPAEGNIFLESTANGIGNFFYETYWAAERKESTFTATFFSWFEHEEYEVDPIFVPPFTTQLDREMEARCAEAYNLNERQLAFRRLKMREPGMKGKFVQEYPSNPEEAFIASGQPYFDRETLTELLTTLRNGRYPALELTPEQIALHFKDPKLHAAYLAEELVIYELPEPGDLYGIGADVAEGLMDNGKADFCSADVIKGSNGFQCAHLHGKWDPHTYAGLLVSLATMYNMAVLAPERNNHGHAVINSLLHTHEYPNIYEHEEYDAARAATSRRPGWPTSAKSKTLMLDTLGAAVLTGDIKPTHIPTVQELNTFIKKPGGKAGSEGSSHDDRVISLGIAHMIVSKGVQAVLVIQSTRKVLTESGTQPSIETPVGYGRLLVGSEAGGDRW